MNCPVLKRGQYGNIGLVGCCAPLWMYKQSSIVLIACHMFPKPVFAHIKARFVIMNDLALKQLCLDMRLVIGQTSVGKFVLGLQCLFVEGHAIQVAEYRLNLVARDIVAVVEKCAHRHQSKAILRVGADILRKLALVEGLAAAANPVQNLMLCYFDTRRGVSLRRRASCPGGSGCGPLPKTKV